MHPEKQAKMRRPTITRNAMSDNSTEAVSPVSIGSGAAFGQAMIGVKTRCGELATSIGAHDFEGIEYTARDAADMWLMGRAACRRLLERSATASPYAEAARRLLEENYIALLELFDRATRTIDVPRTRRALAELRSILTTAMAHPLSGAPITTPPQEPPVAASGWRRKRSLGVRRRS